ncbi:DUF3991 domain-containing protein [bacterium AH-315-E09]|nr:DUF3991 domain-containing protein [bacterium AH-315-E09]
MARTSRKKFTTEEIIKATNVSIIEYAKEHGYEIKKVAGAYKMPCNGGLYINEAGDMWNRFSNEDSGGGVIQFVMEMENKTWVEAVKKLLGSSYDENYSIPEKTVKVRGKLVLPKKNDNYKHLFAYLIKTRKIDKEIVSRFVKEKKIYEDTNRNCVFVGYDEENKPRYASLRGTNTNVRFCGDVKNSDKGYPFHQTGTSSQLLIFESAIDLLSFLTILKMRGIVSFSHHMISLGGMSYLPIEKYLAKYTNITNIITCLDADVEGQAFAQRIREKFGDKYEMASHMPEQKDFNEELIKRMEVFSQEV